ncbi:MAG: Two component signal transduction histidine kinase [Rubrobacteraceae bacterium]|jgi:hypothetical protein|nr:Two component signal transduction histidine kinase [Rubrobacteraceae bacterium]
MSTRTAAWIAWSLCAVSVALMALALALLLLSGSAALPSELGSLWGTAVQITVDFALPILGGLIASRRPDNLIGWIVCAAAVANAMDYFADGYATYALLAEPNSLPGGLVTAWVSNWVPMLALGLLPFFLLLFPTGRLPSRRWRPVAVFAVLVYVVLPVGYAVLPGPLITFPSVENPLGHEGAAGEIVPGVGRVSAWMLFVLTSLVSLVSLVLRFRRSRREERQQIKWVAYAAAIIAAYLLVDSIFGEALDPISPILSAIFFGSLWVAIGVAILKYRLYNIDLLINRTLVYGALTAILAAVYFGGIVVLQRLFVVLTGGKSTLAVVASTLVIAALFNPLRRRIQSFIDRRFYRRKYDVTKTLETFSAKLREETDLDALSDDLVGVVRETMQPAHVSLWLRPDSPPRGSEGPEYVA